MMKEKVGFIMLLLTQAAIASTVPERGGNSTQQVTDSRNIRIGIIFGISIGAIVALIAIVCAVSVALYGRARGIRKAASCLCECLSYFLQEC